MNIVAADSPRVMRRANMAVLLRAVRDDGPISRPALARASGLSNPTVTQIVNWLVEHEFVTEFDPPEGSTPKRRGPKAKLLSFRTDLGYVVGIDTGADNTVAKVADLTGRVLATSRIGYPRRPARDGVLEAIRTVTTQAIEDSGIDQTRIRAAVIGTPGVVDPTTGAITLAPQIVGWEGIVLNEELAGLLPCTLVVDNEANLSLLAEHRMGGARGETDVVYVQLGIGIGGALLIDGKISRGISGAAGEFAYLNPPDVAESVPPQDGSGPFEWYAGGRAYQRHGIALASSPEGRRLRELAGGDPERVTARILFEAAREGDPGSLQIAEMLLTRLGRGLASIAVVLNPSLIIVGGGISSAGPILLAPIEKAITETVPHPPRTILSTLGNNGAVLGAITRAIDLADQEIFDFAELAPSPN